MRYAIISDIHGNLPALKAVLQDAERSKADKYIFTGDYFMCSPYVNDIVNILKSFTNSFIIKGNEEDYLLKLAAQNPENWTDGQFSALYWCYKALTNENRVYLTSLPERIDITANGTGIHAAHSSAEFIGDTMHSEFSSSKTALKYKNDNSGDTCIPQFSRKRLLNDINSYLNGNIEFLSILSDLIEGIYIFGHSHVQWHASVNNRLFINPGSCGLCLDFEPGAPYTLLDITQNGWQVEERRIKYDIDAYIHDIKNSDLYEKANIWCNVVIKELLANKELVQFFLQFVKNYADSINDDIRPYSHMTWRRSYEEWERS